MILQQCFVILRAEYIRTIYSTPAAQHFRRAHGSGCTLILSDCYNDVFSDLSVWFSVLPHNHKLLISHIMTAEVFYHIYIVTLIQNLDTSHTYKYRPRIYL